jgi:hypothetical protein
MILTTKPKLQKCLLLQLLVTLIASSNLYAQQRKHEEKPTLSVAVKSMTSLIGWKRNDIGKWQQAFNGVPFGEQTLKVDIAKVKYESQEHYCFAKFSRHFYYRENKRQTEYFADFWLFDIDTTESLNTNDTSIHTKIYNCLIVSHVLGGLQPVSWNDILNQMEKCFIGTYPNDNFLSPAFFIKYRYSYSNNKAQFYFGGLGDYSKNIEDNSYEDFTNNEQCYDKAKNTNLNCCYFETIKNIFDKNLKDILQKTNN